MIKEIGSDFWETPTSKNDILNWPETTAWYISGRAALLAIINDIKKTRKNAIAALPSWCCDSIIRPFLDSGIKVVFYSVYIEKGVFCQNFDNIQNADILLLMDYFGFNRLENINFNGIKICDATHSVFSGRQQDADYYFGSLRKWCGFYTGGFAYSKNGHLKHGLIDEENYINLRKKAMQKKEDYINGKTDSKDYLELFSKAEELLESQNIFGASLEDVERAKHLDIGFIRKRRRENANFLIKELEDLSLFKELNDNDCPLFVPIVVEKDQRDKLKKYLIQKDIYCPVHWPQTNLHKLNEKTKKLYETELSVVCDQRYFLPDMERIAIQIKTFLTNGEK